MNLAQVRSKFITATGRADFISNPAQADWFINRGLSYLDSKYTTHKSNARHVIRLKAYQYYSIIPNCTAIHEVYFSTSEGIKRLKRKTFQWMRDEYGLLVENLDSSLSPSQRVLASTNEGTPEYYCPLVIAPSPATNNLLEDGDKYGFRYDLEGLLFGHHYNYNGVMFAPVNDTDGASLSIHGRFKSPPLVKDTDTNFWAFNHPDLLVFAAAYKLEVFYRNTQGANDWLNAINQEAIGLEQDVVEQEADFNQIEG